MSVFLGLIFIECPRPLHWVKFLFLAEYKTFFLEISSLAEYKNFSWFLYEFGQTTALPNNKIANKWVKGMHVIAKELLNNSSIRNEGMSAF